MHTKETVTVYVIGRCPTKGCRNRRRLALTGTVRRDRVRTWASWGIPSPAGYDIYPGQYHPVRQTPGFIETYQLRDNTPAARANFITDMKNFTAAMRAAGWICDTHDRFMTTSEVRGTYNQDRTCNARCTAATGADCECTCAGTNHGADHDQTHAA